MTTMPPRESAEALPLDRSMSLRRHVMSTAMRSFGGWGYRELQVPLLQFFDALRPGLDESQIERSFRFVDRGGNLMILRPDTTPVIAQHFAQQMRSPSLPLRISYMHKVVRVERSFTRSELESYQIGIEHLGGDELTSDLEVLLVALEVLERIGLPGYQLALADHRIAHHVLKATGAPRRIRQEVLRAIIARDADDVRILMNRLGTRPHYIDALACLAMPDSGLEQLDELVRLMPGDNVLLARRQHLRTIHETLVQLGLGERVDLQLGELGGESYYTGIGFAVVCEGASRELGRGGRYDELVGLFGRPTPGVGFALSLEALLQTLHSQPGATDVGPHPEDAVVVELAQPVEGLRAALERRRHGQTARLVVRAGEGR
jgi:ATP phosphoribosyltransferase regulatory subunit